MAKDRKRFADPVLKTWDEANENLREIGTIDLEIQTIEAEMNRKIVEAKQVAETEAKVFQDRRARLEFEIKDFAEAHKAELDGKSKSMNFGEVGFRKSTSVIISKVKNCLAALKNKSMFDCIKTKETVNKEILRTYSDEILEAVGARRKKGDVFWLKPDYEKLQA
ncbi:MAG: host-nuclease inhibitor Gam family protein [Negativicutes bacterium]|nr:host-nuclease inhibitor Gam family protein [Negativicutes bacterium]